MSHVTAEFFAVVVWVDLAVVTAVFGYLLYALLRAGGIRSVLATAGERADEDDR